MFIGVKGMFIVDSCSNLIGLTGVVLSHASILPSCRIGSLMFSGLCSGRLNIFSPSLNNFRLYSFVVSVSLLFLLTLFSTTFASLATSISSFVSLEFFFFNAFVF